MKSKKIKITESQYKELKEQGLIWRGFNNYKAYQAEDDIELFEYLCLDTIRTNLPMRIFVDDGYSYTRHEHPLWVYMCNGYSRQAPVVPISVSKTPCVLLPEYQLNVLEEDLQKVYAFIIENYDGIVRLANDEIDDTDFKETLRKKWYRERTTANRAEIEKSKKCGCASCMEIFDASEVEEYIHDEKGDTAVCPYCFTDAVIGDGCGCQITTILLEELNKKWF